MLIIRLKPAANELSLAKSGSRGDSLCKDMKNAKNLPGKVTLMTCQCSQPRKTLAP